MRIHSFKLFDSTVNILIGISMWLGIVSSSSSFSISKIRRTKELSISKKEGKLLINPYTRSYHDGMDHHKDFHLGWPPPPLSAACPALGDHCHPLMAVKQTFPYMQQWDPLLGPHFPHCSSSLSES
ncbi:hypothetical protein Lal_00050115 [Lupinus albus]|nr:hypothetical protein Lal_00050115 [Lupinus albus]